MARFTKDNSHNALKERQTMAYAFDHDDDSLTVRIRGRLDIETSPEIEGALTPQLEGVKSLTIDLEQVDYVSSMGLRLLLALQKRMSKQGAMLVTNVGDEIMELFEETGFSDILTIA